MKPITYFIVALLLIFAADISYNFGQQKQRDFEALCEASGVRCVVQLSPWYVERHPGGIERLPYATYEFREDGGLSGSVQSACIPGDVRVCVKHDGTFAGDIATTTPGGGQ